MHKRIAYVIIEVDRSRSEHVLGIVCGPIPGSSALDGRCSRPGGPGTVTGPFDRPEPKSGIPVAYGIDHDEADGASAPRRASETSPMPDAYPSSENPIDEW